jgi:hypothetical protein
VHQQQVQVGHTQVLQGLGQGGTGGEGGIWQGRRGAEQGAVQGESLSMPPRAATNCRCRCGPSRYRSIVVRGRLGGHTSACFCLPSTPTTHPTPSPCCLRAVVCVPDLAGQEQLFTPPRVSCQPGAQGGANDRLVLVAGRAWGFAGW